MRRTLLATLTLVLSLVATSLGTTRGDRRADVVFTGRVLDAAARTPLAGAQVALKGTRHAAPTGPEGRYRLVVPRAALGSGPATLVVTLAGYRPAEQVVPASGDLTRHDVYLHAERVSFVEIQEATVDVRARAVAHSAAAPRVSAADLSGVGAAGGRSGGWNTEEYDRIEESDFVAASHKPLSTFSIDVDRASYSNVRRFLASGQAPPKDAVRIEEMVNYFPYEYPEPRRGEPFSVTTEVAAAPWRTGHLLLRVGLQSARVETAALPPSNLVFLIDVSGSMQGPDKLPLVKQALRLLVNELRPRDHVALVVYAGAAGLVLPSTPGSEKTRILAAIEELEAGGSTAGGAGLRLAYDVAREGFLRGGNNRVILATDGDFNVGVSSDAEMVRLVEARRREGTFLTVLGFGTGNLKDAKMEKLADHGNGNYAYVDGLLEARKVLVSELGGTLLTVARDVKLQVEFNPERVRGYRLIGYENRALADHEFNDDARDAGEIGAGHSVTALYEVIPAGARTDAEIRGVDPLRYQAPGRPGGRAGGGELAFVKVRYKEPTGERSRLLERPIAAGAGAASGELHFAAAVAGFGMLLRESEHRGSLTVGQVLDLARRGLGRDAEGYRADFIRLVESFRALEPRETEPTEGRR